MVKKALKIKDTIQGYMIRCESKKLSLKTRKWYEQKLTSFCRFMEDQQKIQAIKDVTTSHLRVFIIAVRESKVGNVTVQPRKSENVADLTVKGYVQVLKGFFNWCLSEELIKTNPATRLENPQVSSYVIPMFDEAQIMTLLASCDLKTSLGYRDHTIMLLLLDTGIRLSELCGLKLEDIHRDYIKVFGKGSKEREVGLHPQTAQHIWKYVNKFRQPHDENERHVFLNRYGKPFTISGVGQAIADAGKRAGLSGVRVSPHTFRHTYSVMYLDGGGDLFKLSRSLGHSEIGTTEVYLKNFRSRDARREHDQFSPIARLKQGMDKSKKSSDGMFD